MKVTVGSLNEVYGTIEWDAKAEQYRVTGPSREFLEHEIPYIEDELGLEGLELVKNLGRYFCGADKWVKTEE